MAQMNMDFQVEASVHKGIGEGFRVKASIIALGQYINGMMVYPPNDKHDDWVVYTPTANKVRTVEFRGNAPLWKQLCESCIEAVKDYMGDEVSNRTEYRHKDIVIEDIPDGPIDLSDIPDF